MDLVPKLGFCPQNLELVTVDCLLVTWTLDSLLVTRDTVMVACLGLGSFSS